VVPADARLPGGLLEIEIGAGRFACATHVGSYATLGDSCARRLMGEWLPASGHRVGAGDAYELYRNNPMSTPEAELRTEMYVPIA
jgi:AraC family transcriptional regulator